MTTPPAPATIHPPLRVIGLRVIGPPPAFLASGPVSLQDAVIVERGLDLGRGRAVGGRGRPESKDQEGPSRPRQGGAVDDPLEVESKPQAESQAKALRVGLGLRLRLGLRRGPSPGACACACARWRLGGWGEGDGVAAAYDSHVPREVDGLGSKERGAGGGGARLEGGAEEEEEERGEGAQGGGVWKEATGYMRR